MTRSKEDLKNEKNNNQTNSLVNHRTLEQNSKITVLSKGSTDHVVFFEYIKQPNLQTIIKSVYLPFLVRFLP